MFISSVLIKTDVTCVKLKENFVFAGKNFKYVNLFPFQFVLFYFFRYRQFCSYFQQKYERFAIKN